MFMLAEAMRWNHLPVEGGIYDQHPQLLTDWLHIWEEKSRYEEAKAKQEEQKARAAVPTSGKTHARRGRRLR